MKTHEIAPLIFSVPGFWSREACQSVIVSAEAEGFGLAPINTAFGPRRVDAVRNNTRVMHKNESLAAQIWDQLRPGPMEKIGNSVAVGLNEMFRIYRYLPGEQFRRHRDGSFIRNAMEASYFTLLIYLNDDFTGGETRFDEVTVIPRLGDALIFLHTLEHSGEPVHSGVKYVLRSDLMYRLEL